VSIDTKIEGNPSSIRASATWLNNSLATAVDQSVSDLFSVRDQAESGWQGDAGPAFHSKMDAGGRKANNLHGGILTAGGAFNSYADDLTTAQNGMERARDIARQGGLRLQGDTILDPGAGPTAPVTPAGTATPEQVAAYNTQVAAYNDHQAKLTAYAQAETQAKWARDTENFAKDTLSNALGDLKSKPFFSAADFATDGVIGALYKKHTSILKAQSKALAGESETAIARYLKTPGGTAESKALNLASWSKYLEADGWQRNAVRISNKVEARLPLVGFAITAADVAYDIHNGKPAGKAIISGAGGFGASLAMGALVGGAVGGPPGLVLGAAAGVVAGLVTSGALDAAYDHLSPGVQHAIEGGFDAIGHGVGDAGGAVGHEAKKVWNSIF
jgi:uncharacterized protein YukE